MHFGNLDSALEWYQNRLIVNERTARNPSDAIDLTAHEMCRGLTAEEFRNLHRKMTTMSFARGETPMRQGTRRLHLSVCEGEVTVTIRDLSGKAEAGLALVRGDSIWGDVRDRSASAIGRRADNEVVCYALPMEEFDALDRTDPKMKATLYSRIFCRTSRPCCAGSTRKSARWRVEIGDAVTSKTNFRAGSLNTSIAM
jgi:hypothetical protein